MLTLRAHLPLIPPSGKHVVFGKVVRGYETIQELEKVSVDQKDRPTVPIEISNCGELVLRTKQESIPKGVNNSIFRCLLLTHYLPETDKAHPVRESEGESDDDSPRHKKRRHRHASKTRDSDDEAKERRHKKSKHRRRSPGSSKLENENDKSEKKTEPGEETEEQYDARLEREEKERLEAARKKELERLKKEQENVASSNGVRFKGMSVLRPIFRSFIAC